MNKPCYHLSEYSKLRECTQGDDFCKHNKWERCFHGKIEHDKRKAKLAKAQKIREDVTNHLYDLLRYFNYPGNKQSAAIITRKKVKAQLTKLIKKHL